MKYVSGETYEAFVKLLNSEDAKTRYEVLLAMTGFDVELIQFIEELKKICCDKEESYLNIKLSQKLIEKAYEYYVE